MGNAKPLLIALYGPTAVGKTEIAVELGRILSDLGEEPLAISADALAVYREIPILTGAPTAEQQALLPHRLVGIRSITESFSAGEYAELAHRAIDEALSSDRRPILVGGTGLYMRSALCALDLRPPVADEIRSHWQERVEAEGPERLHALLATRDPEYASRIPPTDSRRITRALELLDSGHAPPARPEGLWGAAMRVPSVAIGLTRESDEHRDRVTSRARSMIESGGPDEVRQAELLGPSATARAATGWDELRDGDADLLSTRTWQLVRRQRTWMRRSPELSTCDVTGLTAHEAAQRISSMLDDQSTTEQRS